MPALGNDSDESRLKFLCELGFAEAQAEAIILAGKMAEGGRPKPPIMKTLLASGVSPGQAHMIADAALKVQVRRPFLWDMLLPQKPWLLATLILAVGAAGILVAEHGSGYTRAQQVGLVAAAAFGMVAVPWVVTAVVFALLRGVFPHLSRAHFGIGNVLLTGVTACVLYAGAPGWLHPANRDFAGDDGESGDGSSYARNRAGGRATRASPEVIEAAARLSAEIEDTVKAAQIPAAPPSAGKLDAPPAENVAPYEPTAAAILFDADPKRKSGGSLDVSNVSPEHAICKLIDTKAKRKILSIVIPAGAKFRFSDVPDGQYRVVFAYGKMILRHADRFESARGYSELDESFIFKRELRGKSEVFNLYSITLNPAVSTNATTPISKAEFDLF